MKSVHVGVSWDRDRLKWRARIKRGGTLHSLGRFHDEEEAARAYRSAAEALTVRIDLKDFSDEELRAELDRRMDGI